MMLLVILGGEKVGTKYLYHFFPFFILESFYLKLASDNCILFFKDTRPFHFFSITVNINKSVITRSILNLLISKISEIKEFNLPKKSKTINEKKFMIFIFFQLIINLTKKLTTGLFHCGAFKYFTLNLLNLCSHY